MPRTHYSGERQRALGKRRKLVTFMVIVMIPLTLLASVFLLNNTKYMITSLLVIGYTMVPFFMVFEKKKPKAREIVLIATMTALTVCVHIFFHLTIPIQIGTAMVVIAGIGLGPEAGFLVGALSRLVCNFYLGQGPWTPWQMFCWGLMGFLAGALFAVKSKAEKAEDFDGGEGKTLRKTSAFTGWISPVICILAFEVAAYLTYLIAPGEDDSFWGWRIYAFGAAGIFVGAITLKRKIPITNLSISIYTFFATIILFGGIMNMAMMLYSSGISGGQPVSINTLRTLYITGFPYDLSHGIIASCCTFVIGKPMIEKIERIKIKYGLYR